MILVIWVTVLSALLIAGFEWDFQKVTRQKFSLWKRWLLPLPIFLFLASNLYGVLNLRAWLETHPNGLPIRYPENKVWHSDQFATAALSAMAVIPLFLCTRPILFGRIALVYWIAHFMWAFLVLLPLMLAACLT